MSDIFLQDAVNVLMMTDYSFNRMHKTEQLNSRSFGQSVGCSVSRSVVRSFVPSFGPSFRRSVGEEGNSSSPDIIKVVFATEDVSWPTHRLLKFHEDNGEVVQLQHPAIHTQLLVDWQKHTCNSYIRSTREI